jgi:hypothetical protein
MKKMAKVGTKIKNVTTRMLMYPKLHVQSGCEAKYESSSVYP